MKPVLAIGLGNPLMGDDGVGCAVAERLAGDARLPEWVEVICGGSDLLRHAGQMEGRSRIVVIDAIQDEKEPGTVLAFADDRSGLDERQHHAHHLSAIQAIGLLGKMASLRCTLLGICIPSAAVGMGLSPAIESRMPAILERVLQELQGAGGSERLA